MTYGERVSRSVNDFEREEMADYQRAKSRLQARQRRVRGMAADSVLVMAGIAALDAIQALWAGRLLETLAMAALAVGCWTAAGVIREGSNGTW